MSSKWETVKRTPAVKPTQPSKVTNRTYINEIVERWNKILAHCSRIPGKPAIRYYRRDDPTSGSVYDQLRRYVVHKQKLDFLEAVSDDNVLIVDADTNRILAWIAFKITPNYIDIKAIETLTDKSTSALIDILLLNVITIANLLGVPNVIITDPDPTLISELTSFFFQKPSELASKPRLSIYYDYVAVLSNPDVISHAKLAIDELLGVYGKCKDSKKAFEPTKSLLGDKRNVILRSQYAGKYIKYKAKYLQLKNEIEANDLIARK